MTNKPAARSSYLVSSIAPSEISKIIAENVGPAGITEWDLDRIKVPAGGGTLWTLQTLEGEQAVPTIEGVIVHWRDGRVYWRDTFAGGSTPPDCSSRDGVLGIGTPGGDCSACPLSKFGSAASGTGQACKQYRLLYVLTRDKLLPTVIVCPPTSIAPVRKYLLRLAASGVSASSVVTSIGLERVQSRQGIAYSQVTLSLVERLDDPALRQYVELIRPVLDAAAISVETAELTADCG